MISEREIKKEDVLLWLEEIVRGKESLIAPVRNQHDDVLLLPVQEASEVALDFENTGNSIKEYVLPNCESLFAFEEKLDSLKVVKEAESLIAFGLRSCDVSALHLLDSFFGRDFKDNYYFDRRDKLTLISLACPEPFEGCFCTATKTGPFLKENFDLQLVPLEESYLAQVGSPLGERFVDKYKTYFSPADKNSLEEAKGLREKALAGKPCFNLDRVYEQLKAGKVPRELWTDISERCQSCGLCLFICPTCSCYTVVDRENTRGEKRRMRQWDACYFRGFTRMAGNSDPVRSNEEMVQRKYNHKLWQQIDEFGMSGCAGCGRCSRACVGNVNWLDNIVKLTSAPVLQCSSPERKKEIPL